MTDLCKEYLIHSYLYYDKNVNIISDEEFDRLCVEMLEGYDGLVSKYKPLVSLGDLRCGTGFNCKYPDEIKLEAKDRLLDYEDLRRSMGI